MKYDEVVKAVNEVLGQYDMPLTLRQVYYRLVSKLLIPNTVTAYKTLSRLLVKARERGEVDDSRIEDRSRQDRSRQVLGTGDFGYSDFDSFIDDRIERLKDSWEYWARPQWENQPQQVLIAVEKDALSRLFVDVADKYKIHVYPTRGYGSYTYIKQMAEDASEITEKPTVILYFGDYDPSGRDIQRDVKERLLRYGSFVQDLNVNRIALTKDQISQFNLPPRPEDTATLEKLMRDPRTKTYGMEYACELDALEPPILQELIRKSIEALIDVKVWNATVQQIREESQKLKEKLERVKVTFEGD